MKAHIIGIETALPAQTVTNEDLRRRNPSWDMAKIAQRTGVLERRICAEDETALDLGLEASERLFERTKMPKQDVGAVIFCTQSPDHLMPANASLLHHRLGLQAAVPAFDFTHACSGFVYGLWMAQSLVRGGGADNILLVTADSYSRYLHPRDRSTVTLFGDAGAATLIGAGADNGPGIGEFELGTDGEREQIFWIEAGGARVPRSDASAEPFTDAGGSISDADHIYMDGPGVLAFVRQRVPGAVNVLFAKTGSSLDDVDLVICHQASAVSLEFLHRWLRVPEEKQFINIEKLGNTVSASIPIALREAEIAGRLEAGMRVLVVGFGVGLSWGICLIDW